MDVFKRLKMYYWPERKFLFGSLFGLVCAVTLGLIYPNLLRYLIDDVIQQMRFDLVPELAWLVIAVITVKASFQFLQGFCGGRLGNRVAYRLRNALYEKLQYISFQYYDKAKTGDLMSRLTADLEAIRNFIGFGFVQIIHIVLMFGFGSVMMLTINWQLTLVTFILMPCLTLVAIRFENRIHPGFRSIRKAMSNLTATVQENITGVRTVKSFARETFEVDKFSKRNEEYLSTNLHVAHTWAKYFPFMELLSNMSVVILLAVGGYLVMEEALTIGELVAFFSLIWYIVGPMRDIGFHINNYTQSKASGERLLEILHQPLDVRDGERPIVIPPDVANGHVRFEQVSFQYPGTRTVLHRIDIDAKPGTVIGLLGGTGAGKSTIIQLLFRAYNIGEGKITFDGIDIRDIALENLREHISLVFQETFLFSSTIRNNIAYGRRDVTMEDVIRAAKLAKAHDFIMELPLGYDTVVGERGLGLSGGQKQRIAIARAVLRDPKVLVLDDATSAVDMETEHEIQQQLREVMRGRTTFIIAHRISSLKHADEIIVLDRGVIVQRGTHEQLLNEQGPYLDTYNIQYADRPEMFANQAKRRLATH